MKVEFKVLQLVDSVKNGSELEVGNSYSGIMDSNRIIYTDNVDCEWIFYVGDTCELCVKKDKL